MTFRQGQSLVPAIKLSVMDAVLFARIVRVATDFLSLLKAERRLHRGINIEDPELAQEVFNEGDPLCGEPAQCVGFKDSRHRVTDDVLADGGNHVEYVCLERLAAKGVDVGVRSVTCQNEQARGAEHVDDLACAVAGISEWAGLDEALPALVVVEELGEEDELAVACERNIGIGFGVKAPAGSIDRPAWIGLGIR
ncbi:MAG: hypothetical protein WCO60_16040 [Verrucomicrobiota bacterium]